LVVKKLFHRTSFKIIQMYPGWLLDDNDTCSLF